MLRFLIPANTNFTGFSHCTLAIHRFPAGNVYPFPREINFIFTVSFFFLGQDLRRFSAFFFSRTLIHKRSIGDSGITTKNLQKIDPKKRRKLASIFNSSTFRIRFLVNGISQPSLLGWFFSVKCRCGIHAFHLAGAEYTHQFHGRCKDFFQLVLGHACLEIQHRSRWIVVISCDITFQKSLTKIRGFPLISTNIRLGSTYSVSHGSITSFDVEFLM